MLTTHMTGNDFLWQGVRERYAKGLLQCARTANKWQPGNGISFYYPPHNYDYYYFRPEICNSNEMRTVPGGFTNATYLSVTFAATPLNPP